MVSEPEQEAVYIELIIEPIPPQTVFSARAEIRPLIEAALREAGREDLLTNGEFQVEMEKTVPMDEIVFTIGITLLSGIALETYKYALRRLEAKYKVSEKPRRKTRRRR